MNAAVITLTAEQVASVLAQNAGAELPPPSTQPSPPPIVIPPAPTVPQGVELFEIDWANPQPGGGSNQNHSLIIPDFAGGAIKAIGFTTGSTPTSGSLCRIAAGDWPSGSERKRRACFSLLPGDFDHAIPWGVLAGGQGVFEAPMGQVTFPFALGNFDTYYPTLKLRTHYYLNILNMSDQNGGVFVDLMRWNLV